MGGGAPRGKGTKSPLKIFVNIFISFIGAGVLGLPYTFRQSGIAEGILIMTVVAVFSSKAMLLVVECKYVIMARLGAADQEPLMKENPDTEEEYVRTSNGTTHPKKNAEAIESMSYSDVGFYATGPLGQRLVDFSILLSQVGFCCAYLIFITENLSSYIPGVHRQSWLFGMLPLLFLLTLYRELKNLAFFSLFAQISNILAFAVVFWFDIDHIKHLESITPREWSLEGLPFFFAVAIYCYEGAGMILSLEASVAKEKRHKFRNYFISTITFVTLLYITFGVFGYLSFGNQTNPIITLNLPAGEGFDFAMLVKMCLCFSLFFTYPVMIFPVTELLERQLFSDKPSFMSGNILRFCLVALTGVVVNSIPSFANLMALIGATCCTLLAFILPGTFHLLVVKKLTRYQRWLDYLLIFLGILAAIVGTLDTIHRLNSQKDAVAQAVHRGSPGDQILNENGTLAKVLDGTQLIEGIKKPPGVSKMPGKTDSKISVKDHFKEQENFTEEVLENLAQGSGKNGSKPISLTDLAKAASINAKQNSAKKKTKKEKNEKRPTSARPKTRLPGV